MPTRIAFMGTPEFAVPALRGLLAATETHNWQVVVTLTQPDRPKGRGRRLTAPPVKEVARNAEIPVLQPEKLTRSVVAELAAYQPDVIIVAAFGQILRKRVLNLPPYGCLNVHASLLPRWRGAAPIQAAIKAGDTETGVTLMQMDPGLDTGPMLAKRAMPITREHTGGALTTELAELGADLLVETLPAWLAGELTPEPQDDTLVTYAPQLRKEDGEINWEQSALEIEQLVRTYAPWPGTFTKGPRGVIKVVEVAVIPLPSSEMIPGTVFKQHKHPCVATGSGAIQLVTVQPAGKKIMPAVAMMNGQPDLWNSVLGV
jgi:methionyl-tRNA formyltransferase